MHLLIGLFLLNIKKLVSFTKREKSVTQLSINAVKEELQCSKKAKKQEKLIEYLKYDICPECGTQGTGVKGQDGICKESRHLKCINCGFEATIYIIYNGYGYNNWSFYPDRSIWDY